MDRILEFATAITVIFSMSVLFMVHKKVKKGEKWGNLKKYVHVSILSMITITTLLFANSGFTYLLLFPLSNMWFYFYSEVKFYESKLELQEMQIKVLLDYKYEVDRLLKEEYGID